MFQDGGKSTYFRSQCLINLSNDIKEIKTEHTIAKRTEEMTNKKFSTIFWNTFLEGGKTVVSCKRVKDGRASNTGRN